MTTVLWHRFFAGVTRDSYESAPLVGEYESFDDYEERTEEWARHMAFEEVRVALVARAHEAFDVSQPAHAHAVEALWTQAFPGEAFPANRCSPRWRELGFQGDDPVRDLRGAGVISLLHLTRFMAAAGKGYRAELGDWTGDFPLALASFSCSAMLCRYLGLNRTLIVPGMEVREAPPAVVHSLLLLEISGGNGVMETLHGCLLRHLAWRWQQMPLSEAKIMSFNDALRATSLHLHQALNATPQPWQMDKLTATMERADLDSMCTTLWPCTPDVKTVLAVLWLLAARLGCGCGANKTLHSRGRSGAWGADKKEC